MPGFLLTTSLLKLAFGEERGNRRVLTQENVPYQVIILTTPRDCLIKALHHEAVKETSD